MSLVTSVWSAIGAATLTLAAIHALAWVLDRRNVAYLMFFWIAVAVADLARCDVAMMHASSAAEYGEWVRWYHVPTFALFVGYVLFVRTYLGTGRIWLAWTIIAARLVVLVVNFLVQPNFTFQSISNLRQVSFLGEHVSVVGQAVVRSWQWLAFATVLLIMAFVLDAAIQCWRLGGKYSRSKAVIIAAGILLPLSISFLSGQLTILQVAHLPLLDTPLFLVTIAVMTVELSRTVAVSTKAREEAAQLRVELARVERVTTLGQLASALAHEISQPLDAILINTEAADLQLQTANPDLNELRSIVTDIRRDDTRAGEIIDRIRALIKRADVDRRALSLDELVRDVLSLVHSEALVRGVVLDCVIEPGVSHALGDRVQVSQVLLNLILNAMEALQGCPEGARRVSIVA